MTEREHEREFDRGPDMDGEELVNGTGGGTENVIDVTRETKGTGRKIGSLLVGLLALILLALPVAWILGRLATIGALAQPMSGALAWIYASLFILLGIAAAFYAYTLWQRNVA